MEGITYKIHTDFGSLLLDRDGGTFLFTHQRDDGMLMWYPDGAYSSEAQGGAWIPGGKTVHSFGC